MFIFLHNTFRLCCKKSTPRPFNTVALSLAAWICLGIQTLSAQILETFDSTRPRFQLWHSDCKAQLGSSEKTEPGVEVINVSYTQGTFAYLIYPIQPCAAIDDLHATIAIRGAQSGIKIGFRVVFPRSTDPVTHDPLVEVLLGNPSEGRGRWSTSSVSNVESQLEAKRRVLRARFGPSIDLEDPYIDGVVLSVYSLPGTVKLQLDDLHVEGMIAPNFTLANRFETEGVMPMSSMSVNEQLRTFQATIPRVIQYQGESLDLLKSLGFNAIIASDANDPVIIEQANRTQMGVIAPPPEIMPNEILANNYKHIRGWSLGMALDQSQLEQTRAQVARVTRFPKVLARPMVGEALEAYGSFSRLSDSLAVPFPLATRVRSSHEANQVMRSDLRPMAGRSTPITSIVTQMPQEWVTQKAMAYSTLRRETTDTADYDLLQVRLQVYTRMAI
jgi:hypothetical protein